MKKLSRIFASALALFMAVALIPDCGTVSAAVLYMPDVTAEMSYASYWSDKVKDPDKLLAEYEDIRSINQALYDGEGTEMRDMAGWSAETFNGIEQNEATEASLTSDAKYYSSIDVGWWWDEENQKWSAKNAMDNVYAPIIANGIDPDAAETMKYKFAICTTRTCMQGFPTDYPLWDDPTDPDFDYLYHTMIRVNEPVILMTQSADDKYYLAMSSAISGWIPAEDVAICQSKEEWLDAWNTDNVLVVCDDKIYTEDSNSTPETANRKLPMGTALPLADESEITGRISNRTAHNNHVVWMPVRNEDGSFSKQLALIGENRNVSEGWLPLTTANIMTVAMRQLGDTYGWGGMLSSEDCSGYMRDVYSCFGLNLARSRNRDRDFLKTWSMEGMTDEAKAALIKTFPPGTILTFSGHEMMYLGCEGDKLYVISSVSNVRMPGDDFNTRIRGTVINTLDIMRASNTTWLSNLNYAVIPYYDSARVIENPMTAKGNTVKVKYKKLKKADQIIAADKAITLTNVVSGVTCEKVSGKNKIKVAETGDITVKKGLAKGKYKVKVKVTAASDGGYAAKTVTAAVKIRVK